MGGACRVSSFVNTSSNDPAATLRALITRGSQILVAPGCYDALSAALIQRHGFAAAYVSGASIAYTRLGQPDVGLVTLSEVADVVTCIRERVTMPLLVDADTGFGNALNLQRTVQLFERAGASALQIEDQQFPKRCGHLAGKRVVPGDEMVGKIRAACDARRNPNTVLIARTDAVAIEGLDAALERAERYLEAGADVLFVEALPSLEAMADTCARFAGRAPLLANMVEGGRTPLRNVADLQRLGFAIAIFPGALVRAQTFAAEQLLAALARDGATAALRDRMLDFPQLNELLGTQDLLANAARYG
jgi:2-methylisocitrate lyase-like PEP mutase family enzyme